MGLVCGDGVVEKLGCRQSNFNIWTDRRVERQMGGRNDGQADGQTGIK